MFTSTPNNDREYYNLAGTTQTHATVRRVAESRGGDISDFFFKLNTFVPDFQVFLS